MVSQPARAIYDLAVIGGGINGCGIARDAAGRGASVLLLEAADLASGTSSASTKLIHGGLRYLEHYEFGLVRESLKEREVLWRSAPHIVRPMRFVMPHVRGLRPRWLLRLGLFLYDHIGGRDLLPGSRSVALARHPAGAALRPAFDYGFVYSDCWVDDARLVVLNARDCADRGGDVRTRTKVTSLARTDRNWRIGTGNGSFRARALVNATGPGVLDLLASAGLPKGRPMRLVRGSHIVVPKLFDHGFGYFLQMPDGRVFFALPFERDFTLIGTTDVDHPAGAHHVEASDEEIAYLCEGANTFFHAAIEPQDVVWTYSGVRPLIDDGSGKAEEATRGYVLDLSDPDEGPPLLNVYGGKLTTYRHLAEQAVEHLGERLPVMSGAAWTGEAHLPGGDFAVGDVDALVAELGQRHPSLGHDTARRLVRAYGRTAFAMLAPGEGGRGLGEDFGHGLSACEVDYLVAREWACDADDVLWRRTKLGLRFSRDQRERLAAYITSATAPDSLTSGA